MFFTKMDAFFLSFKKKECSIHKSLPSCRDLEAFPVYVLFQIYFECMTMCSDKVQDETRAGRGLCANSLLIRTNTRRGSITKATA
jgi:hypothetical protein